MSESKEASRSRVAAVSRRALAAAWVEDEVPEALVRAVARGEGDREDLRRLAPDARLDLLLFDTDRIGRWVYESSRPPVIAGASKILEQLNRAIEEEHGEHVVFSGGGEGLLLLPAGRGEAVRAEIERRYAEASRGALTVTVVVDSAHPADFVAASPPGESRSTRLLTGTPAVLARLRDRSRRAKDERLPAAEPVPGSALRCVSCRDRAGVEDLRRYREERGKICTPCDARWAVGKPLIDGTSFEDLIDELQGALGGESEPRDRHLGFLYADGDAMGLLFRQTRSLAGYRFLSRAVASVFEAVRDRARARTEELLPARGAKLPFLSLLGGGDEVILLLPGAAAVDVAGRLAGWVEAEVEAQPELRSVLETAGRPRLTVGTGLLLADLRYPVRYQYQLAQALQKNAKRRFYGEGPQEASSSLDFLVLTDASPSAEDLSAARRVTYGTAEPGFSTTCRPYRAERFATLLGRLDAAKRAQVAGTQLYQLRSGADEGEAVFLNLLRYQVGRAASGPPLRSWLEACKVDPKNPEQIRAFFVDELPAGRGTWLVDALELAPFLGLVERLAGRRHAAA